MTISTETNPKKASLNQVLRGLAGVFIIISVIMIKLHSPHWIYFILFIGINLLQSAFTKWCPMMTILKKIGFR